MNAGSALRAPSRALVDFAEQVGTSGPFTVVGGRSLWDVGGSMAPGVREVTAPTGVVTHHPDEMTVLVNAGTPLDELDAALAAHGQTTALADAPGTTVGGALAVGRSGPGRLRHGPVRDAVLQIRYVSAEGRLVTAGGPTVKNVTGYDLCRLLVGSLGTLGAFGDVILRTRPRPAASCWLAGSADPFASRARLFRPTSVLWDGATTWVLLEGHPGDVAAQGALAASFGLHEVDGPPSLPACRRSVDPARLRGLADAPTGRFVAEIGVGVVHVEPGAAGAVDARLGGRAAPDAAVVALHAALKQRFDPTGRCNPGRDPLRAGEDR